MVVHSPSRDTGLFRMIKPSDGRGSRSSGSDCGWTGIFADQPPSEVPTGWICTVLGPKFPADSQDCEFSIWSSFGHQDQNLLNSVVCATRMWQCQSTIWHHPFLCPENASMYHSWLPCFMFQHLVDFPTSGGPSAVHLAKAELNRDCWGPGNLRKML